MERDNEQVEAHGGVPIGSPKSLWPRKPHERPRLRAKPYRKACLMAFSLDMDINRFIELAINERWLDSVSKEDRQLFEDAWRNRE